MKRYVSTSSIKSSIEYFRNRECSKPEQIGLFLYFKAAGLNQFGYSEYKKWGEYDSLDRERFLRNLYDLAGVFDASCENGLKYTALFPFSISNYYKPASFYNGGTSFKMLGSRISDTLDNSLVSTIIQRDTEEKNSLKFNDNYISYIAQKQLKGYKISLCQIASWCFRFWQLDIPIGVSERDITDSLILSFLSDYKISTEEYKGLFSFDNSIIETTDSMITGSEFRTLLHLEKGDCSSDIQSGVTVDYMPIIKQLNAADFHRLLSLRGAVLNEQRILEILQMNDNEIKNKVAFNETEKKENKKVLPVIEPRGRKNFSLNSILYGAPGTGKTYSTAEYAMAIIEERKLSYTEKEDRQSLMIKYKKAVSDGRIVFTTFHQSYGYEDFIQGLRPISESGQMSFLPMDGVFKKIADKAMLHPSENYVIIIDEINRANISKVFGELITLIEEDKRWGEINALSVTLPSGEEFAIPNNLYILGTMNSADKSISLIDTALRRRFDFIEVVPNAELIEDGILRTVLTRLNEALVKELDSTDLLIGHAYFIGKTADDLCNIMNKNIIPLLYEYFYDNSKKVEKQVKDAVDGYDVEIQKATVGRIKLVKKGLISRNA